MAKYLLILISFFLIFPISAYSQTELTCPVDWVNDPKFLEDNPLQPEADGWHDFNGFRFEYNFPKGDFDLKDGERLTDKNLTDVDVTFETNIPMSGFTRLYANMSNIIYPFVNASDEEVLFYLESLPNKDDPNSEFNRWLKNYCLGGILDKNPSQEAEVSLYVDADMTAEVFISICGVRDGFDFSTFPGGRPTDATEQCNERTNSLGSCDGSQPIFCATKQEIDTVTRGVVPGKRDTESFPMPYRLALRDIALKTSYAITEQYCETTKQSAEGQGACLNPNYTCIKEGDRVPWDSRIVVNIPDNDPAAIGKDGKCYLNEETATKPITAQVIQRMCTEILETQAVGSLNSIMCHYGDLEYKSFTPALITVDPKVNRATGSTSINSSDASTNKLPFDIDLFVDNGETVNPACSTDELSANCLINGYFRRALYDKLSLFSDQDRGIFDQTKYRVAIVSDNATSYDVNGTLGQGGGSMNYGFGGYPDAWSFDYIEKLGGYMMLAEEARFMNNDLLPAGDRVVADGGYEAYLRGGQVVFNNHIVSNRPLVKPDGSPIGDVSAGYDDFLRLSKAMSYLMEQARTRLSGDNGAGQYEVSPLYACLRYQNSNGLAQDPDGANPAQDFYRPPGSDMVDCQLFAQKYNLNYKNPLPGSIENPAIGIDPIKDPRVAKLFDLFWQAYTEGPNSIIGAILGCISTPNFADCIASRRDAVNETFEKFFEEYNRLRDEYQSRISNYNPTLHCINQRCLVTYNAGPYIYAGVSEYGRDISQMIQMPLQGETFNQIPHKAFITNDSRAVIVYSSLDSTYKILIYNFLTKEIRHINTPVGFLGHVDADYYVNSDNIPKLLFAYFQEGDRSVKYSVYDLQTLNTDSQGSVSFQVGGQARELFGYFRHGVSVKYGYFNDFHLIAPTFVPGAADEGFSNDLMYARVILGSGNVSTSEIITTNQDDRASNRIPNIGQNVYASRLLAQNGKSIFVDFDGVPYVVWINRVVSVPDEDGNSPTEWETYTQAFMARKTSNKWSILPVSDRAVGVLKKAGGMMSEIRNIFISPSGVGMTVVDAVTKRDRITRMMDGAGAKRCVYDTAAVLFFGSTHCANIENDDYVKPNAGNWEFIPAVRP